jgi:hypothetical protein
VPGPSVLMAAGRAARLGRRVMPDSYRSGTAYGLARPLDSRLSGTGLVGDDLWLLAHHEVIGRPYLQARQLGLGLAGGLLAELMTGRIRC